MFWETIFPPMVSLGGVGFLFGAVLAFASKKFEVKIDERAIKINSILPAANCGACGYPGCANYAEAVVGGAQIDKCTVGGAATTQKIADIMGVVAETSKDKQIARVKCGGGTNCVSEFNYFGVNTCSAMSMLSGGNKSCKFACLGAGDCIRACKFDAIVINEIGVAQIDREKCVGCTMCVAACPKSLIDMLPYKSLVHVDCKNKNRGAMVRKNCSKSCIACKMCERECPFDAIHVIDNVAVIDYVKCVNCRKCVKVCPTGAINAEERKRIRKEKIA